MSGRDGETCRATYNIISHGGVLDDLPHHDARRVQPDRLLHRSACVRHPVHDLGRNKPRERHLCTHGGKRGWRQSQQHHRPGCGRERVGLACPEHRQHPPLARRRIHPAAQHCIHKLRQSDIVQILDYARRCAPCRDRAEPPQGVQAMLFDLEATFETATEGAGSTQAQNRGQKSRTVSASQELWKAQRRRDAPQLFGKDSLPQAGACSPQPCSSCTCGLDEEARFASVTSYPLPTCLSKYRPNPSINDCTKSPSFMGDSRVFTASSAIC